MSEDHTEENLDILEVANLIFKLMQKQEIDLPIAMGGMAAALSMMAAKLGIPQEDLLAGFKTTMELMYEDYREDKEANTH